MNDDFSVFVVEDETMMIELLDMVLAGSAEMEAFTSAEACLSRMETRHPDALLLDVGLPGMDGYAFCRKIREDAATASIPVIFISGFDTIEARLAGYEAGGDDFVVKPFQPDELLRKIGVARRIAAERRRLDEAASHARNAAFSAMTGMGELGVVIEFLRASFACADSMHLARETLDALRRYDLEGAVQIRLEDEEHSLSAEGADLPLETAVLNHVRHQGRIFEFSTRSVYNFGGVTLMVKNMPLGDAERCGRIRDNLAILAEGADARLRAIVTERRNRQAREGIVAALADVRATLGALEDAHKRSHGRSTELLIEAQEALVRSFVSLGLTEGQENSLAELLEHFISLLRDEMQEGFRLVGRIAPVEAALGGLLD